jgi:phosphatidylinositol phospholipase C gamma-1
MFIDYRAEKKIKHCRIKQEGRLYTIGSVQFESLVELVSYYKRHPLYHKIKLWYPVNEDFIRGMNPVSNSFSYVAVMLHFIVSLALWYI